MPIGPDGDDDLVMLPSGLLVPEHVAVAEIRRAQKPKAVDFYAGAGGMSLGAIQSGFEVVAAVENDPACVATYMTNLCRYGACRMIFVEPTDQERMEAFLQKSFKKKAKRGEIIEASVAGSGWIAHEPLSTPGVSFIFVGDSRKIDPEEILRVLGMKPGELDAVFGGPPCQGYSTAGKRDPKDPRSELVFDFARHIIGLNPKTMVMENVTGILSMVTAEGVPVLDKFCRILEDGGFGGFDAFRRSIEHQTGRVGLMRGRKKPVEEGDAPPKKRTARQQRPAGRQLDLLSGEAT